MKRTFPKTESHLKEAKHFIPLGAQTFSKSYLQYPLGTAPLYASRAKGGYLWDIDGNRFLDFVSGLASIILGYCDEDVDLAVKNQLQDGSIFSLSHSLELEVAKKLCQLIPCAESVRFGKNGSDATAGAIRAARAITKRDHVAVCGYHGWQDWYIGSTSRNLGVPLATQKLTHPFTYNQIESLHKIFNNHPNEIAAVILEPMNVEFPKDNFLEEVKKLTHKNNALLIFDETVTGFRYALGGAQEYFNVIPDLATFGKGMANGYPISAVVGKKEYMKIFEEIFFSFTYGGETLSLAAALATLNKLEKSNIPASLYKTGSFLKAEIQNIITKNKLDEIFAISGHPVWSFLVIKDAKKTFLLKTYLLQEFIKRNILTLGTHNLTAAHADEEINDLLTAYQEILKNISDLLTKDALAESLDSPPVESIFKVR